MSNLVISHQETDLQNYDFEIGIEAKNQAEADVIVESLLVIQSYLKPEEITMIADFIDQDPKRIDWLKKWIKNPPVFIKIAVKAAEGLGFK